MAAAECAYWRSVTTGRSWRYMYSMHQDGHGRGAQYVRPQSPGCGRDGAPEPAASRSRSRGVVAPSLLSTGIATLRLADLPQPDLSSRIRICTVIAAAAIRRLGTNTVSDDP